MARHVRQARTMPVNSNAAVSIMDLSRAAAGPEELMGARHEKNNYIGSAIPLWCVQIDLKNISDRTICVQYYITCIRYILTWGMAYQLLIIPFCIFSVGEGALVSVDNDTGYSPQLPFVYVHIFSTARIVKQKTWWCTRPWLLLRIQLWLDINLRSMQQSVHFAIGGQGCPKAVSRKHIFDAFFCTPRCLTSCSRQTRFFTLARVARCPSTNIKDKWGASQDSGWYMTCAFRTPGKSGMTTPLVHKYVLCQLTRSSPCFWERQKTIITLLWMCSMWIGLAWIRRSQESANLILGICWMGTKTI
jgi:hypothetical protein